MSVALSSLVVSFYEIGIGRGGGEERGRRVERVGMEVMRGMERGEVAEGSGDGDLEFDWVPGGSMKD